MKAKRTKPKPTAGARKARKTTATDKPEQPPPVETWFDMDGDRRHLYAIRKNEAGELLFYMDRGEILELTGWPLPLPTLTPADVLSVGRKKGVTTDKRLLVTHAGGAWVARARRRKYRGEPPEASAPTRPEPTRARGPRLTRAHVETLTEPEKNRLRKEALDLVTKGQTASGTAALVLSKPDAARLRDLIRCGMLPSDPPPPRPVTPDRELHDLARKRNEASRSNPKARKLAVKIHAGTATPRQRKRFSELMEKPGTGGGFVPAFLASEAEAERVRAHQAELTSGAIAGTVAKERASKSRAGKASRAVMLKWTNADYVSVWVEAVRKAGGPLKHGARRAGDIAVLVAQVKKKVREAPKTEQERKNALDGIARYMREHHTIV